jgi:hypothetical protein
MSWCDTSSLPWRLHGGSWTVLLYFIWNQYKSFVHERIGTLYYVTIQKLIGEK